MKMHLVFFAFLHKNVLLKSYLFIHCVGVAQAISMQIAVSVCQSNEHWCLRKIGANVESFFILLFWKLVFKFWHLISSFFFATYFTLLIYTFIHFSWTHWKVDEDALKTDSDKKTNESTQKQSTRCRSTAWQMNVDKRMQDIKRRIW